MKEETQRILYHARFHPDRCISLHMRAEKLRYLPNLHVWDLLYPTPFVFGSATAEKLIFTKFACL